MSGGGQRVPVRRQRASVRETESVSEGDREYQ